MRPLSAAAGPTDARFRTIPLSAAFGVNLDRPFGFRRGLRHTVTKPWWT
jgi:hypothetical protein